MNKRKLWQVIGAFALTAVLMTGCGGGAASSTTASNDSKEETEAVESEAADASVEAEEDSAVAETSVAGTKTDEEAPESLNSTLGELGDVAAVDCSFELEGKQYTLPVDLTQFLEDGWNVDADMDAELGGLTYTWLWARKEDGGPHLTIYVFNGTGNTRKLSECKVVGIEVYSSDLENFSFALSNGLKPGDELATVTEKMGTPTEQNDQDTYTTIEYGKSRDTGKITFYWSKDSDDAKINVDYFLIEETSTSDEVPEYLSEYTAPTEMGEDFDSGTFTLDGVIYRLSFPASELVKNGWTVEKDDEVMADRTGSIRLEKGGSKISASVKNYANYQTVGSNCAIYEITFSSYSDYDPAPAILLPKGISFDTDLDALEAAIASSSAEFEKKDKDTEVTFSYYNYDNKTKAYISYDKDKKKITYINISRDLWP